MRRRAAQVLLALSFLAAAAGVFAWHRHSSSTQGAEPTLREIRARVGAFFGGQSNADAYAAFVRAYEGADMAEAHTAAHVFGELLYERTGIDGFSICDAAYGFGCYHSFIGFAMADHGADIVKELDRRCIERFGKAGLGCMHGIGHGVLSYYGYTDDGVRRALDACATLSWKHPYGGCRDGVFMEYNFRTMETDESARYRQFSSEAAYEPCRSIDAASRVACYFSQADWWYSALLNDPKLGEKLVDLCGEIGDRSQHDACVRGIGHAHALRTQLDARAGGPFCDEAASSGSDRVLCREGYAWALWSDPAHRSDASRLCSEGLAADEAKLCERDYLFFLP